MPTISNDELQAFLAYECARHNATNAISGRCEALAKEKYKAPVSISTWGFRPKGLPNEALDRMVDMTVTEVCSPLITGTEDVVCSNMVDVGLVGPRTLTGKILLELRRRLMGYEYKIREATLVARKPTEHMEVPQ